MNRCFVGRVNRFKDMVVELVPGLGNPDIKYNLDSLYSRCTAVKGCTAFLTIPADYYRLNSMAEALSRRGSFFCSDIQKPTDIDAINTYYEYGAKEMYLHRYRQGTDTKGYAKNKYLLHSKILLFELPGDKIEIWMGSHNQTDYAISGYNLEATTIIRCTRKDEIYRDTLEYLERIRDRYCFQFNPEHIDIYKKLQTNDAHIEQEGVGLYPTISMIGEEMSNLETEQVIMLLALSYDEYQKFRTIGENVYIHTFDVVTKKENLYKCRVAQSGRLDRAINKLDVDFESPRRYAYTGTHQLVWLKESQRVDKTNFSIARYFVNISISHSIKQFQVYLKPGTDGFSYWRTTHEHPYDNHKTKIQQATFNPEENRTKVDLSNDFSKIGVDRLNDFYSRIDAMIVEEKGIVNKYPTGSFDEVGIVEKEKSQLENFLEGMKKHLSPPHYTRTLMERIIVELQTDKS